MKKMESSVCLVYSVVLNMNTSPQWAPDERVMGIIFITTGQYNGARIQLGYNKSRNIDLRTRNASDFAQKKRSRGAGRKVQDLFRQMSDSALKAR